jgi:hypothetical protein
VRACGICVSVAGCWLLVAGGIVLARVRTFITLSCPELVYHQLSSIYSQFINNSITLELSTPQLQSLRMQQMKLLFFSF